MPPTRAEAMASGAKKYFTGKPCRRGHTSPRYTRGQCIACSVEDGRTPERRAQHRAWSADYEKTPRRRAARRAYQRSRKVHYAAYYRSPKRQERLREYYKGEDYLRRKKESARKDRSKPSVKAAHAAMMRARAAKLRGCSVLLSPKDAARIKLSATACYICDTTLTDQTGRHLEHIIPIVAGGAHSKENVAVSCAHCNLSKGAKPLDEFLARRAA